MLAGAHHKAVSEVQRSLHASTFEQVRAVRDGAAGTQSGRDVNGFGEFGFSHACVECILAMNLDAVGTLRRERDSDGHQFFVLPGNGAVGEREFVVGAKRVHCFGCEFADLTELADI